MEHAGSEPLTGADRAWLRMEEPTNLMVITSVIAFARLPATEALIAVAAQRLLKFRRFRQRVVRGPLGGAHWEDDPAFDLSAHFHRVALPSPGGQPALEELVGDLMSTPLDATKPLWQVHVIEDGSGGGVLVARLHHCIADGFALMRVVLSLTDELPPEPEALGGAVIPEPPHRDPMAGVSPLELGRRVFEGALDAGRLLLLPADPESPLKGPLGVMKRAAWTGRIPLAPIKEAGRARGATINDVLLAASAGSIRRWLESRAVHLPREIHAVVPMNLRTAEEPLTLGNRFGLLFLPMPVHLPSAEARLSAVHTHTRALKESPEAAITLAILDAVGRAAPMVEDATVKLFGTKASLIVTNVPGPRRPLTLGGERVESFLFFVPQSGHVGVGISLLSYAGAVQLGVASDRGLVPDPESLVRFFEEELGALGGLGGS